MTSAYAKSKRPGAGEYPWTAMHRYWKERIYAGISAPGISTDHESCSLREAREKIDAGMMIQIREGSQSREFDTLIPLLGYRPDRVMLCTDEPESLRTEPRAYQPAGEPGRRAGV